MKKIILLLPLILISIFTFAQVVDCNPDNSPTQAHIDIQRPITNGQIIYTHVGCDPDLNQTITWSIVGEAMGLAINPQTGEVFVIDESVINNSTEQTVSIVVRLTDDGQPILYDEITDFLNDQNNSPTITLQTFNVNENSPNGTVVGTVIASDPDVNQTLTYSIIGGNTNSVFQINSNTGEVTVVNSPSLNFEENSSYALTVEVKDNGFNQLTAQNVITIDVNDVNEAPVILDQIINLSN